MKNIGRAREGDTQADEKYGAREGDTQADEKYGAREGRRHAGG